MKRKKHNWVSLYRRDGSPGWNLTTCKINGRRITRRLGRDESHANRFAEKASQWIDQWKSNLITTSKLEQLLGETLPIGQAIDRYIASLKQKQRSPDYVEVVEPRLRLLMSEARVAKVGEINGKALKRALDALTEDRDRNLSEQTLRHYATAAKQLAKFVYEQGWLERDPLIGFEKPVVGSKKHERRAPTNEELNVLIRHVSTLPRGRCKMIGEDRAILYAFAAATGLRVKELREVRAGWIHLSRGLIVVPGKFTKNKKEAAQPLPAWLVTWLGQWMTAKGDRKVWPEMPVMVAITLRSDLESARNHWIASAGDDAARKQRRESDFLKYKTDAGYFDFHALRHWFVTTLVSSGTNVRNAQTLARHSSSELTIGLYSHTEADRLRADVERAIPNPLAEENP